MITTLFRWLEGYRAAFPPEPPGKPPATFPGFMGHYAKPFWPLILASALLATLVALLEVYLFSFLGQLIDLLNSTEPALLWQDHGNHLAWMAVLAVVAVPVLKFYYTAVIHQGLMGNFAMRIRWQAHRYLLRQSVTFFQDDFAGRIATKMMQTSLAVRDTVMRFTEVFLYVIVYFTAAVFMFAASDLRMTAPMLLWLAGYVAVMCYFVPRLQRVSMAQADARSVVTGRVVDSYSNINTVKMFAHTDYEDDYARDGMGVFLDTVYRQMRLSSLLISILNVLNGLLVFCVCGTGVWLWTQNAISAGAIAFAVGLVFRLQGISQWVMWEIARLFEDIGVVQDGIETIARERTVVDAPGARLMVVPEGGIHYDNISFNYGKAREDMDQGIIENLDLTIKPAQKVGLVGRSGAGKSTLVNLLLRFYDLEGGRITIDGQDITGVTQHSLRANVGMVTQDSSLLHRSIFENIRYGDATASADDVMAAAKKAHAHEFILELEDLWGRRGYEAHVGERGVKLSGGQRQRITIARVLLKNAPILVLDEATSALDSEVEAAIQDSLFSLMEGKTVIAIAHRLSTIAAMDRLIIMDEGKIVEDGTHDALVRQNGLYAGLWARQSGGFLATVSTAQDDI